MNFEDMKSFLIQLKEQFNSYIMCTLIIIYFLTI